ncbi:hypothetical protein ACHAXR_005981 [Thalassiosira sp. AJA248-18]
MRRSSKASSGTQVKKRTSHLDLPSNDDDGGSISKIHPKRKSASKPVIAVAILCGLVAVGTLFYVSNKVFQAPKIMTGTGKEAVPGSNSLPQRFMAQQNRLLPPDSIYRTKVQDIHGDWQQLMQYSGSSNYKELAVLSDKYSSRGFNVLAFPSNDFNQEKDTDAEILEYVETNFPEVHFPIFYRAPLSSNMVFQLCQKHTQGVVEWNFHKYLVNGQGRAVKSYGHRVQPMDIESDIVALLDENEQQKMQVPQTH